MSGFNWHNARFTRQLISMRGEAKSSQIVSRTKSLSVYVTGRTSHSKPQIEEVAPRRTLSLDEVKRRLLDRGVKS